MVGGVRVATLPTDNRVSQIMPVVDGKRRQSAERLEECRLTPALILGCRDERCKVLDLDKGLIGLQEKQSSLAEIQPVETLPVAARNP